MNPSIIAASIGGLALGAILGFGLAKEQYGSSAAPTQMSGAPAADAAIFSLDGQVFKMSDLPTGIVSGLHDVQMEGYEKTKGALQEMALRMSLAKEKGIKTSLKEVAPVEELLGIAEPSEQDIRQLYEQSKGQIPPNMTYEQVKPQIAQYMKQQQTRGRMREAMDKLQSSGSFELLLAAPEAPTVNIDVTGLPAMGPAGAKLVLIEASDYTCPHCQKMHEEVKATVEKFKGQLRFVQANYSLRPAQLSGTLVKGGFCAQKQGDDKFWTYHDKAFAKAASLGHGASPAPDAVAEEVAKEAGLDVTVFKACLGSEETQKMMEATNKKMANAGVSGTPTFFLNGRKLHVHHQSLEELIQAELNKS